MRLQAFWSMWSMWSMEAPTHPGNGNPDTTARAKKVRTKEGASYVLPVFDELGDYKKAT